MNSATQEHDTPTPTSAVAPMLELDNLDQALSDAPVHRAAATLEAGGVIVLRDAGFTLNDAQARLVADASITLPTKKERESRNGRPTVIFDPDRGKMLSSRIKSPGREQLQALMARYADWSQHTLERLFPSYAGQLVRDRTTYRPCERATQQGLHVDATYGRPTEGRGMLRVFCNINPQDQARVWRVGETFEPFAQRFVPNAKIKSPNAMERFMGRAGITRGQRTRYDLLMEDIRGQAKSDKTYQSQCPQQTVAFPSGSAWIAITDLVLHGAVSGQHSLDQTFFLPPAAMQNPERSSLHILERLAGTPLIQ